MGEGWTAGWPIPSQGTPYGGNWRFTLLRMALSNFS